jgi:glycerol-3-phosphate dehydrogenase (NAD(P)+)
LKYQTAIVIGAGAFGTSVGQILTQNFKKIVCLVRSKDVYDGLKSGENTVYLKGHKLSTRIVPAMSFAEARGLIEGQVDLLVSGLPTSAIRHFCEENYDDLKKYFDQKIPLVSLSKGIDPESLELADDLFHHKFSDYKDQICFLSGPSFAQEIIEKQITLVTIAGRHTKTLKKLAHMFDTDYFKVFLTYDTKGLLLGGALKNVLAIGAGAIEGLGYNHNTRAAMITRGITEMLRFGNIFNARPETFYGLSGMGDLILSTTGEQSRNKSFGIEVAKGERTPKEIIDAKRTVVEGYKTTQAVYLLAEKYDIRCSVFRAIYDVLYNNQAPKEVIAKLMSRPVSFEI